jgi:hypothetical protein
MGWRDAAEPVSSSSWRSGAEPVDVVPLTKKKHDPKWLEKSIAAQNAARAASELVDETSDDSGNAQAQSTLKNQLAQAGMAAGSSLGFNLADEARGVGTALAAPARAAMAGKNPLLSLDDVVDEYKRGRDAQRDAMAQATEQNPLAVGAGELGATALGALLPGGAAGAGAKSLLGAVARGSGTGAVLGGLGGFGAGEGAADSAMGAAKGAAIGGALGAGGAAAGNLAPRGAAAVKRGVPSGAARLEELLGKGLDVVDKHPAAAVGRGAAAVVTKGASEGAIMSARALRAAASKIAGKRGMATSPLAEEVGAVDSNPSGLELDEVKGGRVARQLRELKASMGLTPEPEAVDVTPDDIVSSESATNPWAQAFADATSGKPPRAPTSSAPSGNGWTLDARQLRGEAVTPTEVQMRLRDIAESARAAEPSTTEEALGEPPALERTTAGRRRTPVDGGPVLAPAELSAAAKSATSAELPTRELNLNEMRDQQARAFREGRPTSVMEQIRNFIPSRGGEPSLEELRTANAGARDAALAQLRAEQAAFVPSKALSEPLRNAVAESEITARQARAIQTSREARGRWPQDADAQKDIVRAAVEGDPRLARDPAALAKRVGAKNVATVRRLISALQWGH